MRQPERGRGVSDHFRNRGPEAIHQSPGLVFSPPYSPLLVLQYQHEDVTPSLGCVSSSDSNPSGPCGWLSIHQPPALKPASRHTITACFPGAREHLLPGPPPFHGWPEPGDAVTWLLVLQHGLYFAGCNLL